MVIRTRVQTVFARLVIACLVLGHSASIRADEVTPTEVSRLPYHWELNEYVGRLEKARAGNGLIPLFDYFFENRDWLRANLRYWPLTTNMALGIGLGQALGLGLETGHVVPALLGIPIVGVAGLIEYFSYGRLYDRTVSAFHIARILRESWRGNGGLPGDMYERWATDMSRRLVEARANHPVLDRMLSRSTAENSMECMGLMARILTPGKTLEGALALMVGTSVGAATGKYGGQQLRRRRDEQERRAIP